MVAKIKTGRSILGAINYNEHKVRLGKAELILAQGYLKEPLDLSFSDKVNRLTDLTKRNERTQVNALHVSLNFAVSERLDKWTLQQIADEYMEGLGFGMQPYLVYQHYDAGHPHLHLVSTNIKPDGERISFHLLANKASEQSRKQVELNYGLVKAEDQGKAQHNIKSLSLEQVAYGKSETKQAITNVVSEVLRTYKFTSIPEFNAVLNAFNVTADRGSKESRMYEKNGLVYWALDGKGSKIGVPIKASSIYGKPTLKTLEGRFALNEVLRKSFKEQIKHTIDNLLSKPFGKTEFQLKLKEQNIEAIFRHSEDGRLYGVTFVDHSAKAVFNGSDLGKSYSANSLSQIFAQSTESTKPGQSADPSGIYHFPDNTGITGNNNFNSGGAFLEALYQDEKQDMAAISRLQQRKRKKKRRGHSL
ncbi:relaxase/mobilization nuclease domain-containing protein [Mucilaginibacter daejeonensis]|uniref:relaxase/mobilization nuclease domain-containing protein n=1 Tax=Mucilaginibacter daejeonensis TaxID=398049 RepID=UPI001D172126|nr:relaxase/mobilization nuclease domain-containing protein [Mucilaginibacter daejeonensis]UEG51401.1 relaxase/mobilization nuclease domain-containing protein [Mucilaginibacter daejeonensis]